VLSLIFLVLALICFIISAAGYTPSPRPINLTALGLAFWVLSILVGGAGGHMLLR